MTLLVRDEADIVRQNIEFHLKHGVDFIIATDHKSNDGTSEILKEYEDKGVLFLIREENESRYQAKWVNHMGKLAFEKFGANLIFHCDADEFWYPKSGNIKTQLLSQPLVDILKVQVRNVLLKNRDMAEKFPADVGYIVNNPLASKDVINDSKEISFFLFKYPVKVIYKLSDSYLNVCRGNHRVIERDNYVASDAVDITIYHFPIRGKANFFSKVRKSYAAEKESPSSSTNGWHWQRWCEMYRQGELENEYRKLNLYGDDIDYWREKEVVTEGTQLISELGLDTASSKNN